MVEEIDNNINREEYNERSNMHHHRRPTGRFTTLRNILNLAFMIIAIGGVVVYCTGNEFVGVFIIGGAMLIKMVEFCIRYIDK
jgi:hypothetical protein